MAVNLYGLNALEREPGATLTESESGVLSYAERFNGRPDDIEDAFYSLQRRVSVNPEFQGLTLETKRLVRGEGGIHSLDLLWEGTAGSDPTDETELPEPQYFLDKQPSEEPIDSHPNFSTFGLAAFGAVFDDDGLFLGFSNTGAFEDNEYGGLSKYLVGGMTLTRISVFRQVPASVLNTEIPTIEAPPTPPFGLPSVGAANWLKIDASINQRGAAFEVREAWRLSGPNGWLTEVYG